jgi:hypothetical protein
MNNFFQAAKVRKKFDTPHAVIYETETGMTKIMAENNHVKS